jgi:hypothetical protein
VHSYTLPSASSRFDTAVMEGGTSLLDELLAKHQNSAQPESRQLVAVAGAVAEVLAAEGMQPTPTALFAAAMSSLERTEAQGSPEARHSAWPDPCCSLLGLVLRHIFGSWLRLLNKAVEDSLAVSGNVHRCGG